MFFYRAIVKPLKDISIFKRTFLTSTSIYQIYNLVQIMKLFDSFIVDFFLFLFRNALNTGPLEVFTVLHYNQLLLRCTTWPHP